jgi:hypothetical protein
MRRLWLTHSFREMCALALVLCLMSSSPQAFAAGVCRLIPDAGVPSHRIMRCGAELTVTPAPGAKFHPVYSPGGPIPSALRLDSGALLIEFHPSERARAFEILTPLAIAAVRGTKWAVDVASKQTSTFVVSGAVAVTNRRLNQYVVLTAGEGVDVTPADTTMIQKRWGDPRIRALMGRFGE